MGGMALDWLYVADPAIFALFVFSPRIDSIFDATWGVYDGGPCFFASTEEGALWMGAVGENGTESSSSSVTKRSRATRAARSRVQTAGS